MGPAIAIGVILLIILVVAINSIRIAREYERSVVFRLGRLINLMVPPQEVITNDNVTVKVSAVIFFQVVDARSAVTRVFNFREATFQIAQTTLRAVLGQHSLG